MTKQNGVNVWPKNHPMQPFGHEMNKGLRYSNIDSCHTARVNIIVLLDEKLPFFFDFHCCQCITCGNIKMTMSTTNKFLLVLFVLFIASFPFLRQLCIVTIAVNKLLTHTRVVTMELYEDTNPRINTLV